MPNRPPKSPGSTKEPVLAKYAAIEYGEEGEFIVHPYSVKAPDEETAIDFYERLQSLYAQFAYDLTKKHED